MTDRAYVAVTIAFYMLVCGALAQVSHSLATHAATQIDTMSGDLRFNMEELWRRRDTAINRI